MYWTEYLCLLFPLYVFITWKKVMERETPLSFNRNSWKYSTTFSSRDKTSFVSPKLSYSINKLSEFIWPSEINTAFWCWDSGYGHQTCLLHFKQELFRWTFSFGCLWEKHIQIVQHIYIHLSLLYSFYKDFRFLKLLLIFLNNCLKCVFLQTFFWKNALVIFTLMFIYLIFI